MSTRTVRYEDIAAISRFKEGELYCLPAESGITGRPMYCIDMYRKGRTITVQDVSLTGPATCWIRRELWDRLVPRHEGIELDGTI